MKATDSNGVVIIDEKDFFGDDPFNESDLLKQVSTQFKFTDKSVVSPVTCDIVLWDKKSDAKIKTSINLEIE